MFLLFDKKLFLKKKPSKSQMDIGQVLHCTVLKIT